MRVKVYPEGYGDDEAEEYNESPVRAAVLYADENEREGNLCVEAIDDEAKALPGWSSDADATHFKMFSVRATTTYDVIEM